MTQEQRAAIEAICKRHSRDRARLMDIARAVQERCGGVSGEATEMIAHQGGAQRGEVASMVSFYSFLSTQPKGKVVIRLCSDIIDQLHGAGRVAQVLSEELGIGFGQTTPEGHITLEYTPCIGMGDQAPAALVNEGVLTSLSTDRAREMARSLRAHLEPGRPLGHRRGLHA